MTKQMTEIVLFGLVGIAATITHFIVAVIAVEGFEIAVWTANIVGFAAALPVSYCGHAFLTFSAKRYQREKSITRQSIGRFAITALTGFALNQTSVLVFAQALGFPHRMVFFFTILGVACFLFFASKFWAFRRAET